MANERHEYFIDDRGIFVVKSSSYPDSIWHEYLVEFGQENTPDKFNDFIDSVLSLGGDRRAASICNLLGVRS